MKIIDKASWQIDGGLPVDAVVNHFITVFTWLYDHDMLTEEGIEELEDGIDDCASLNDELVNKKGMLFLESRYDEYLKLVAKEFYGKDIDGNIIEKIYAAYLETNELE